MDIKKAMKEAKEAVNQMQYHLSEKPDEKLIEGYKEAMNDYERTGDDRIKQAADFIKKEIDRRGLQVE